jgi:NADPH:quinone reductase-like Zn-dependent oxidoreductase
MKAIAYHRYGSPDVLRCEEIERPVPGDDEVLIDRSYKLEEAPEAIRYLEGGHARGKVVITV